MSPLKFGIAIPYNGARLAAHFASMAEDNGWDGLFVGDAIWCEDPMISLAAAAMSTSRIRLGTMIIPAPLRKPWKIASESVALDRLSDGRLILGLGAGAVWMGWQGFPDEVTDTKARAEMLDETIDILSLLYQRKQFDYDGKHYHVKLTLVDERHYPPKPVQQPRIPLWVVGIWNRKKSMQRVLKCDGIFPEARTDDGQFRDLSPQDMAEIKKYVEANRTLTTPFDIVAQGSTNGLDPAEAGEQVHLWQEAGATWWIEGMWEYTEEQVVDRIRRGPPRLR